MWFEGAGRGWGRGRFRVSGLGGLCLAFRMLNFLNLKAYASTQTIWITSPSSPKPQSPPPPPPAQRKKKTPPKKNVERNEPYKSPRLHVTTMQGPTQLTANDMQRRRRSSCPCIEQLPTPKLLQKLLSPQTLQKALSPDSTHAYTCVGTLVQAPFCLRHPGATPGLKGFGSWSRHGGCHPRLSNMPGGPRTGKGVD